MDEHEAKRCACITEHTNRWDCIKKERIKGKNIFLWKRDASSRVQSCVGKYFHFTRVSASRYQELWAQLCTVNAHRCNNNSNYVAQCYHEIMVGSFSGYSKILIKPRIIFQALHNFKIININRRASNCWIKFYAKQKKVKMCERKNRKLRIVYIVCVYIYF